MPMAFPEADVVVSGATGVVLVAAGTVFDAPKVVPDAAGFSLTPLDCF